MSIAPNYSSVRRPCVAAIAYVRLGPPDTPVLYSGGTSCSLPPSSNGLTSMISLIVAAAAVAGGRRRKEEGHLRKSRTPPALDFPPPIIFGTDGRGRQSSGRRLIKDHHRRRRSSSSLWQKVAAPPPSVLLPSTDLQRPLPRSHCSPQRQGLLEKDGKKFVWNKEAVSMGRRRSRKSDRDLRSSGPRLLTH